MNRQNDFKTVWHKLTSQHKTKHLKVLKNARDSALFDFVVNHDKENRQGKTSCDQCKQIVDVVEVMRRPAQ